MFFYVLQSLILSLLLIFLVHYLFEFFKSTMTVPKVKDLVKGPSKRYDEIYSVIHTPKSTEAMKDELKNFLRQQMSSSSTSTSIDAL